MRSPTPWRPPATPCPPASTPAGGGRSATPTAGGRWTTRRASPLPSPAPGKTSPPAPEEATLPPPFVGVTRRSAWRVECCVKALYLTVGVALTAVVAACGTRAAGQPAGPPTIATATAIRAGT